ncbi:Zinc-finger domain of monoamine-oxidase A repressor R1 [Arabidopsis thaliana]|uniref:Zinc-finger domain of monoamine-oxidase A repressor R1 n=1 Tax=Arabidopsis thaliana TaxID=3702 RepID=A0A1P8B8S1_ARATH|nr:Zinc-finger domain of monoamine-oxidase A repressor R1 [Arabidopsis thaliana]ANM67996.1 Zinc-finger domain of monoamine-oxidase A repressor R1 [Arabidopsis thaliana]|eukprot:NP_001329782.1 Zinc-finger domain of monoamine-oxidase A repressor R1 [Arabidopsis thaliana]
MPVVRTRAKCSIPVTNPNPTVGGGNSNVSIYEKCREDRIKENLQRMKNLGIMDLSLKLKSEIRPAKRRYGNSNANPGRETSPIQLSVSSRRSSRLKNATPVSYAEEPELKKGKVSKEEIVLWVGEGVRPEIYTEEHEKLLGNTERTWELFVDGCDKNGKRIYDPVRGKCCHQCRQKTLGYHTQCSQCNHSVRGQFCGDCLYMRYGEHVLEALENPDWICPVCRDICNCSFCRTKKGWLPTGAAYRKIHKLGYKSVAHYLIQTNQQSETSEDDETDAPADSQASEGDHLLLITDGIQDNQIDENLDDDDGSNKNPDSARKSLCFLSSGNNQTSVTDGDLKPLDVKEVDPATPVIIDLEAQCSETERMANSANKENRETRSKRKMSAEPNPNSIGGRLRQRRKIQA